MPLAGDPPWPTTEAATSKVSFLPSGLPGNRCCMRSSRAPSAPCTPAPSLLMVELLVLVLLSTEALPSKQAGKSGAGRGIGLGLR